MTIRPLPALFATLLCAAVPVAFVHAQAPANKPRVTLKIKANVVVPPKKPGG